MIKKTKYSPVFKTNTLSAIREEWVLSELSTTRIRSQCKYDLQMEKTGIE
jgi:hypothetical protein